MLKVLLKDCKTHNQPINSIPLILCIAFYRQPVKGKVKVKTKKKVKLQVHENRQLKVDRKVKVKMEVKVRMKVNVETSEKCISSFRFNLQCDRICSKELCYLLAVSLILTFVAEIKTTNLTYAILLNLLPFNSNSKFYCISQLLCICSSCL